jgi:hypothetical protein
MVAGEIKGGRLVVGIDRSPAVHSAATIAAKAR